MDTKEESFESCMRAIDTFKSSDFIMVIFGGSGDLSQKKLIPTLYLLFKKKLISDFSILGFGLPEMDDREYRENIKKWIISFKKEAFDEKVFEKFVKNFYYQGADAKDESSYKKLCQNISKLSKNKDDCNLIYYLAVPPIFFPVIVDNLSNKNLCRDRKNAKIIVEKPFGHDVKTAHTLNKKLLKAFNENQIYRIDHYLGKETVQNVFFFRFGNALFEPLWNRNFIDHVQITVAEDIGIENRAAFYEEASVIGDIVQNHIMQLIALVAMEPPANFEAESIRSERIKVLKSIKPLKTENIYDNIVLGQYDKGMIDGEEVNAYTDEKNVKKDSKTPTFFAGKFFVDNWRWANVPFYVRAGKRLKKRITEICINFKYPPLRLLGHKCRDIESNSIMFSIFPKQKIELRFNVKFPGMENVPYPVDMMFDYKDVFKVDYPLAYERILIDAMKSDITLFAREDGIEAMWNIVDPIKKAFEKDKKIFKYKAGSTGPKEAKDLIEKDKRNWMGF
ncbi:MAG: Glucose-6-phosphate 1-dehydrogenase [Candidatus Anoxychlamydiales bacterium]|nr:Glucose-6-phosphate 1-dehydrogenase [Candidatus Anoxychlamydiales bacterium]